MGSLRLIASANANTGNRTTAFQFTNIPQTYTDLLLYFSLRTTEATAESQGKIFINGQEATLYSQQQAQGAGTTVTASQQTGLDQWRYILPGANSAGSEFSGTFCYIINYSVASRNRMMSISSNQTNSATSNRNTNEVSTYTSQTNVITQLDIFAMTGQGNLSQFSTVYLYGMDSTP